MKKKLLVIACLVLVLSVSLILPFASVSADYVEDIVNNTQAIVNFNQYVLDTYTHNYSANAGDLYVFGSNVNFTSGHTYYLNIKMTRNSSSDYIAWIFDDTYWLYGDKEQLYICASNLTSSRFYVSANMVIDTLWLIDLTEMFGVGNEPTLAQCQDVFTASYYAYNTGTPMTYNTIDAYNNGVNAYLGTQEYTISSLGFVNSVYPVILNSVYGCEEDLVSRNTSQGYVQVNSGSAYTDPTLCLPFNYTIPAGTQVTIKGKCSTTQYNASYSMHVGFWGNGGEMIVVPQSMVAGTQGYFRSSTITFTLPMSVDRIYLIVTDDATWQLKDFEVGYYLTNVDALRELGYQDGVAYMQKLYAPTGAYYQAIYQQGYNDGHDAPTYTFKDLIVASVDTPIQAFTSLFDFDILGVNMKTFYLSIFTMCVIFVVLKLVL